MRRPVAAQKGGVTVRLAYVLPAAKTPNEMDMLRAMSDWDVTVIGEVGDRHQCDIELPSRRVPWLGDPGRWTAAIAWLRGVDQVALPPVDLVLSLELFSVSSLQGARLAQRLGVPHVVTCYEVIARDPVLWYAPPYGVWGHRMIRRADAFWCQTTITEDVLLARGAPADRLYTVPSGVDTELFRPAPVRRSAPVITFVGELRPDKGVLDVIAAADLAAPRLGDEFRVQIVGDGELRGEVDGLAASRPWLQVLGRLPRAGVAEVLQESAAFILAPYSRLLWTEQLGFASIEAMACGLPVVATSSGAVAKVVPAYNPLVEQHDVKGLANGIVDAVGPSGDKWGRDNRAHVLEHYSLAGQAEVLSDALTAMLSLPRRRAGR